MLNVLVTCGGMDVSDTLVNMVHLIIVGIQVVVPIILIIFGMLDMAKAVLSNDEKTMKEGQSKLIKRIIYAVVVFLIVAIVRTVVSVVVPENNSDGASKETVTECINAFVNGTKSNKR